MTLHNRVAKLEQQTGGQQGDGVWGIRHVHWERGSGPDVVRVGATGECVTEAEFRARYPRGLLIHVLYYGDDDPPAAGR